MRKIAALLLAAVALAQATPTCVLAQGTSPAGAPAPQASTARLVVGGLLGGGVGVAAGGLLGAYIGGNRCADDGNPDSCHGLEGFVLGVAAGGALGIPLGVHIGGGKRGRALPSIAASAAIAGAGAGLVALTRSHGALVGVSIVVPAAQLVSSVLIERRSGR